ncbi:efflux RND transporter periplasmic adaptor subunit [Microbulbifer yueqingensis]|uniref:Membrane fusion protein, Cu(I)/Ag(I) efflux system n=1 Tax=Microbulbifer yueqingensis TaxID=658219 RepID=A0A1G9BNV1_9GAMM|nr:efflux RND transporter periplasmic adaptor subunit [Microbulbifer yueqingensis]SDK41137.1 membrane fusion protein, Cu(I)/Ag(I) efflux system [Microbulbifer yueqingensis]
MRNILLTTVAALAGLGAGWWLSADRGGADAGAGASAERKILYWVAPMDSSYRRDGPGKSPMGMDLVPVYEGEEKEQQPGTVNISSQVQNNLGVRTAAAELGEVATGVRAVGLVRLDEQQVQHQHSRLSGWVQKTWVKAVGDRVRKGQSLLELYSPELVKAQSELAAAVKSGNRTLVSATRERLQSLGIPNDQIRRVETTGEVRETITLYAEASGYVNKLGIREGMYITPANALVSVGPLDTVWVEGDIFPREGQQVREGGSAEISADIAPDRRWDGRILQVLPNLDEQTRTLTVRVEVDNPDQVLRPGMFVQLELDGPAQEALTVPRSALIRTGKMDRVVLAEGDGNFRSVRVRAGREFGDRVEILEGLQAGEEVVTSAQFLIDSESSISADLERIEQPAETLTPWAHARVLSMPDDNHYARLEHGPVAEWDWPSMVMGFYVADSAGEALRRAMESDREVMVQLRQREDEKYEVIAVRAHGQDQGESLELPAPRQEAPSPGGSHEGHGGHNGGHDSDAHAGHGDMHQ